jgi:hypothetical protein
MKNIKRIFGLFVIISMSVCLIPSCKKGDVGPQGAQGPQGATGETGAQGAAGLSGNTLLNGEGVPTADLGKNGDFYLDLASMSLYGPKTAEGWGSAIPVRGLQGEAGADGNANVIVDTFTVANEDWGGRGDFSHIVEYGPQVGTSFPGMYFTRYNTAINESVLDSGMVMVSYRSAPDFDDAENRWTPMPMSFQGPSLTYNLDFTTNLNSIRLEFYLTPSFAHTGWASQEDVDDVNLPTYKVKVVTISSSAVVQEILTAIKARKTGAVSAN